MYSPQRYRVPYQKSPNRTLGHLNAPKRKSPERLTLDEFAASKKAKLRSNRTAAPPREVNTIIPTQRTPPPARTSNNPLSTVSPRRISMSPKNVNNNRLSMSRISPNRKSPITPSRMSTIVKANPSPHRIPITQTKPSNLSRSRNSLLLTQQKSPRLVKKENERTETKPTHYLLSQTIPTKPIQSQEQRIEVCVRKRPLNKRELAIKEQDIATLSGTRTIEIHAPKQKVDLTKYTDHHSFTFDQVFDPTTSNRTIYQKTTKPLVEHMFQGGKATCFAYGQTGSGKTYTMLDPNHGLYIQATTDIFRLLNKPEYKHLEAWVGYYEIYQGQLYDLLNKRQQLIPREDGKGNVHISVLKEHRIHSSATMMQVFDFGNRERTTCKTKSNDTSSRSHAILQILLKTSKENIYGKLNFIDLAGSERGTDRGINSDSKLRLEGAEINRSLLALKECIRALDQDKKHAPFRGSKLTMVLKDSFVGNSRTCMIATISPNNSNSDHTLNTLKYADRVKELRGESDPRLFNSQQEQVEEQKLDKEHIQQFLHWHQVELQGNEMHLEEAKRLIDELTADLNQPTIDSDLLQQKYTKYKQNLQDLFNRKVCFIENLKNRIKKELVDEHEI
ncbi:P-loop containing nucleoside triphosphate hydrolase protein [Thamnidium elegans]|nr:P-loop containing nucleoside triphosphate hydrolase protein [Thamnidium elegans]